MNYLKKAFLVLLVLIVAAAAFYFFYYQKTPAYSLITIQQSFRNRDLATFEKHVDLEQVLGGLFDEIVEEQSQGMEQEEKRMVSGLSKLFKVPFVQAAKENILKQFTQEKADGKPGQKQADTKAEKILPAEEKKTSRHNIFQNFSDSLKLNKMDYKGSGNVKIEGDTASADIILHDTKLQKDYTFTARLVRLPDRTWRLTALKNVNTYLRDVLDDKLSVMR